MTCLWN